MKKRWLVIAALYLPVMFFTSLLPFIISFLSPIIPEGLDSFITGAFMPYAIILLVFGSSIMIILGIVNAVRYSRKDAIPRDEAIALMRTQVIMRILQIPVYIAVFILGSLFMITIFTIGFTLVYILVDLLSIIITGLFAIPVYKQLQKNNLITAKESRRYRIFSFIYCLDVIVALICYLKVKTRPQL